jgi:2-polyprenyl-3-methyl-5-hydroxy-6-metoxy-1,4-benzoquinol methylase
VGVDPDLPALLRGIERHVSVRLLAASAEALPFREGSFDCVIFSEVLEHVPSSVEGECIRELRRVIVPGGTLLFSAPHRGAFWWLDPLMAKTHVRRLLGMGSGGNQSLKGHKHYRVDEIQRLLQPHFEVLLVERRAMLLHPLAYWGHLATARMGKPARLMRFWQALIDNDYSHEYGNAAYNVCMVARAR